LQAWAHQLKVNSATDERVQQFITALRQNRWVYPEAGATCQQPSFDTVNPPAFDPSPPGPDAVTMAGVGGTPNTTEMSVPDGTVITTLPESAATAATPAAGATPAPTATASTTGP
jgi:hypothetical protein